MLVAGIPHRSIEHGKCGPRSLLPLIDYLAELSREDVIGLVSPMKFFDVMRRHTRNCPMWQGGKYVVPL